MRDKDSQLIFESYLNLKNNIILEDDEKPTIVDENGYLLPNDQYNEEESEPLQKKHVSPSHISKLKENVQKTIHGKVQTVKMVLEKVYLPDCLLKRWIEPSLSPIHSLVPLKIVEP